MINTPSPLRYPGGKTILYEKVKNIIEKNIDYKCTYVEPFAGGAGLALKLLFNGDVDNILINDYDYAIYCVWDCILNYSEEYIQRINEIEVNLDEWEKQHNIYINKEMYSNLDVGIATLFLNRTNVSGVIKGGPIGGYKQNGKYKINCRFNKVTLIDKIKKISEFKNKIKIYNLEANEFIENISNLNKNELFIYLDPPYFQKGPMLYKNFFQKENHENLSETVKNELNKNKWIITYDNSDEIKKMYSKFRIKEFNLPYSAGANKQGTEIMIYSDILENI